MFVEIDYEDEFIQSKGIWSKDTDIIVNACIDAIFQKISRNLLENFTIKFPQQKNPCELLLYSHFIFTIYKLTNAVKHKIQFKAFDPENCELNDVDHQQALINAEMIDEFVNIKIEEKYVDKYAVLFNTQITRKQNLQTIRLNLPLPSSYAVLNAFVSEMFNAILTRVSGAQITVAYSNDMPQELVHTCQAIMNNCVESRQLLETNLPRQFN